MQTTRNLTHAELVEVHWTASGTVEMVRSDQSIKAQFDPASLRVTYTNQVQSSGQSQGATRQFVGKGSSKLAIELIFDLADGGLGGGDHATGASSDVDDIRTITARVAALLKSTPAASGDYGRERMAGVRFVWGTFLFDGMIESMDETLDLWSEDGRPLRATVALSIVQPGLPLDLLANSHTTPLPAALPGQTPRGTRPLPPAAVGASVQGMVASKEGAFLW